jgi:hypothetical protein
LDPRFAGSKLAEDYGFLRAINISDTTSFGGEVKPVVRSYKILRRVKDPCSMKEILAGKIQRTFLSIFLLPCYSVSAGCCGELGWMNQK